MLLVVAPLGRSLELRVRTPSCTRLYGFISTMPTRTRSATRSEAATLSEAAMDRALGDPLIVRHILLQAAVGDARRVGRLAKAGRTFWQGSNGSQAQDIVKDPASRNCVACESCRQRVTPNLSIYALRKREVPGYLYFRAIYIRRRTRSSTSRSPRVLAGARARSASGSCTSDCFER